MVRVAPMTHTLMFWPAARVPDIASPLCLLSPQDAARKRESAKHRTTTTRSSIAQADENSYRADRKSAKACCFGGGLFGRKAATVAAPIWNSWQKVRTRR